MPFLYQNIRGCWILLAIFISLAVKLGETTDDKTINLKIGFDLTQGANGAPSLRLRDFEGSSEFNHRVEDDADPKQSSPSIRADSFSDSDEEPKKKKERAKFSSSESDESGSRKSEEDNEYSDENNRQRSTKGIDAAEYDPEESPKIHGRYHGNSDSDHEAYRYRQKRSFGFDTRKRKVCDEVAVCSHNESTQKRT